MGTAREGAVLEQSGSRSGLASRDQEEKQHEPGLSLRGQPASPYQAMRDGAHWPEVRALIDQTCCVMGTTFVVGGGFGGAERIHFTRYLRRDESQHERARECFDDRYPEDPSMPRRRPLAGGKLLCASWSSRSTRRWASTGGPRSCGRCCCAERPPVERPLSLQAVLSGIQQVCRHPQKWRTIGAFADWSTLG